MATDLAEFVGAAIALNLLFGVPLFHAGLITAVVAFGILALQGRSGGQYRRFELVIGGMLGIILLGFLYDTLSIGFDAGEAAQGFIPGFAGTDSVLLATGILGATVMPHVIYLHSALTQGRIRPRDDDERRALLRFQRVDVTLAMGIAGLVNMSMLIIAASLFHDRGLSGVDTIEGAHSQFDALVGAGRRAGLRARAARLRPGQLERRHVRRPGRHAGLHRTDDPARAAPRDHHGARAHRAGQRREPEPRARHQPGRPELRDPVRARARSCCSRGGATSWGRSSTGAARRSWPRSWPRSSSP